MFVSWKQAHNGDHAERFKEVNNSIIDAEELYELKSPELGVLKIISLW